MGELQGKGHAMEGRGRREEGRGTAFSRNSSTRSGLWASAGIGRPPSLFPLPSSLPSRATQPSRPAKKEIKRQSQRDQHQARHRFDRCRGKAVDDQPDRDYDEKASPYGGADGAVAAGLDVELPQKHEERRADQRGEQPDGE